MHSFLSSSSKKPKLRKNWNYKWFHFYKLLLSWLKKRREKWWWLARETHFHKWRKKKTNKRNNSKWVLFYYYNIYPVSHHQRKRKKRKKESFSIVFELNFTLTDVFFSPSYILFLPFMRSFQKMEFIIFFQKIQAPKTDSIKSDYLLLI